MKKLTKTINAVNYYVKNYDKLEKLGKSNSAALRELYEEYDKTLDDESLDPNRRLTNGQIILSYIDFFKLQQSAIFRAQRIETEDLESILKYLK